MLLTPPAGSRAKPRLPTHFCAISAKMAYSSAKNSKSGGAVPPRGVCVTLMPLKITLTLLTFDCDAVRPDAAGLRSRGERHVLDAGDDRADDVVVPQPRTDRAHAASSRCECPGCGQGAQICI